MSSGVELIEHFVERAGFDRAPWLAVAFGAGISAWFLLKGPGAWAAVCLSGLAAAFAVSAFGQIGKSYPYLRQGLAALSLAMAAGCGTVWVKSELTGVAPIERNAILSLTGVVIARQEQPAEDRSRLVIATRDPFSPARVIRVRLNVPTKFDTAAAREGALVRVKGRLVPPAPPILPGAYDFARAAWFQRLAATGSALGAVEVLDPGEPGLLDPFRRFLSRHVRERLSGSAGGIASAFASGDRGGIAPRDEDAMRDSGLTHLLSVSGLHVSAVIGGTYLLALRLLALWPWLALRVRLPIASAATAASVGVFYTILTGAEVPTVRSVAGALLVLFAIALGRQPLSLRLLAVAGFVVMLVWPESVVGPSFQLSFAAVLTIMALHGAPAFRAFSVRRQEPLGVRFGRNVAVLLITGLAIETALVPIVLFHFHRAGIYGSFANVIAIPLTTFVTMPLIALGLFLDVFGVGGPVWWATGQSLDLLLALAHLVARQPGAVTFFPTMSNAAFALFVGGGLWLALWSGRARLWGMLPVLAGTVWLATLNAPDVLISSDGRHVAFTGLVPDTLVMLRDSRSSFVKDSLTENAGISGPTQPLDTYPGARCNADFCTISLTKKGRSWRFLLARGREFVPLPALSAACARADFVVADRRLPRTCRPAVLKIDRSLLDRSGGVAIDLGSGRVQTVADDQGEHGWWRPYSGKEAVQRGFQPTPAHPAPRQDGTSQPSPEPVRGAQALPAPDGRESGDQ